MATSRIFGATLLVTFTLCSTQVDAQGLSGKSTRRTAAPPATTQRGNANQSNAARKPAQQAAPSTTAKPAPKTAAPQQSKPATTPQKPAAPATAAAPVKISPEVLYTPPKTQSVEELSLFLNRLLEFQPQTDEELAEYQKRAPELMNAAASRILQLEKDQNSAPYRFAMNYLMAMRLMEFDKTTGKDRQEMFNYISTSLSAKTLDPDVLDLAVAFAENLEFVGETKLAAQTYAAFATKIAKNEDPLVAELAQSLTASARRLGLIGQPMKITGKMADGRPFRWEDYRGKVVVVDFWATWCGPCVADIPKLREHYKNYQSAGLEIVGISLDQDAAQLQEFLKKNQLPWTTLHEGADTINPTAKYYGISALPTTMVIDRKGNVVALNARGEQLDKVLGEMFGQATLPGTAPNRR